MGQFRLSKTSNLAYINVMRNYCLVTLFLCTTACSSPTLVLKSNVPIEELGIYLEADRSVMLVLFKGFQKELDEFILRYNAKGGNPFLLRRTENPNESSLRIKLIATKLVSPQQQTTAAVVSLIGLSLPIIMAASGADFAIFFYYFPKVRSLTELSFSEDINASKVKYTRGIIISPGFLKSPEKQIQRHILQFDRFLERIIRLVSSQYKKGVRGQ